MLVEPSAPPTSRPLGQYFDCDTQLVERTLVRQAQAHSNGNHRRLGEWLLEDNAISISALYDALRRQRVDRLAACRLFTSLNEEELASVSEIFQEVSVVEGASFICEDESDTTMYVLASGRCQVYRGRSAGREISLAHILPGEPIGELGYFAGGSRTASVRAIDDCQLLRARYEDLSALFEQNPGVASAFMEIVTERLRDTNLLYQRNEFELDSDAPVPIGPALALRRASRADQLSSGIDRLLRRIVRSASRITDAEQATLYAVDDTRRMLVAMSAAGGGTRQTRQPLAEDLRGWVIESNRLANVAARAQIDDDEEDVDEIHVEEVGAPPLPTEAGVRSVICAPVRGAAGRVVGLLEVVNKRFGAFLENDEMMMRSLAAQASVCIENIDSFTAVRQDFERATDLLEVATVALQAPDVGAMVRWLAPSLSRAMVCERIDLLLLDSAEQALWTLAPAAPQGTDSEIDGQLAFNKVVYPLAKTLVAEALMSGKPMRWLNVYDDDRFDPEFDRTTGIHTSSMLAVPVRNRQGDTVGMLQALNGRRGGFSPRDESLLVQVAEILCLSQVLNTIQV